MVKRLTMWSIMIALVLGAAELLAFLFVTLFPNQFQPDPATVRTVINMSEYQTFLAQEFDGELGWTNPVSATLPSRNCVGETKTYTFDDRGARWSGSRTPVDVIVVGDSFTRGAEANDDETYPFWLSRLTGLGIANYGVSGFGPLQMILQFERVAPRHPEARIAILAIMNEDLLRLPTKLRWTISQEDFPYSFQPYVDVSGPEPITRPNLNAPPVTTVDDLQNLIVATLRSDYWSRPEASWPYSLSLLGLPNSMLFRNSTRERFNQLLGHHVMAAFEDQRLLTGLRYVVDRFVSVARARNLLPVIAFIPGSPKFLESPKSFIEAYKQPGVLMVDVGEAPIEWQRYNLYARNGRKCHPSAYGYEMIARYMADALQATSVARAR